jgi:hypothetical protein
MIYFYYYFFNDGDMMIMCVCVCVCACFFFFFNVYKSFFSIIVYEKKGTNSEKFKKKKEKRSHSMTIYFSKIKKKMTIRM